MSNVGCNARLVEKVNNLMITSSEEELSYNLKGRAKEELLNDPEIGDEFRKFPSNFTFIFGKNGKVWEKDFKYIVSVYNRITQRTVRTYVFEDVDRELRIEDYKDRQQRIFNNKVAHGFNTTNVYQEARYILEEVAELMRAVEKQDNENILEELADIVIFSYGCAAVAGVGDLDAKIFEKMKINENRVYTQNDEGDFVKEN